MSPLTYLIFVSRLWQVFLEDVKNPGRLILAKEQPSRPTLDDLDVRTSSFMNLKC